MLTVKGLLVLFDLYTSLTRLVLLILKKSSCNGDTLRHPVFLELADVVTAKVTENNLL